MEWEIMSTPDLIDLAKQLSQTLDELQGFFPILSLNWLRENTLQIVNESPSVLIDTGAILLVLSPTAITQPLLQSTNTVQIVGGSLKNLYRFLSMNLFPFI